MATTYGDSYLSLLGLGPPRYDVEVVSRIVTSKERTGYFEWPRVRTPGRRTLGHRVQGSCFGWSGVRAHHLGIERQCSSWVYYCGADHRSCSPMAPGTITLSGDTPGVNVGSGAIVRGLNIPSASH